MKLHSSIPLSLALVCLFLTPTFAQQSGKGPAYTAPPADDANYPLMGEFVGKIAGKESRTLALQIRPVAGDRFVAIAFYGGLPGQPNHKPEEMNLIGLRNGDSMVLSGGPWALFVDKKGCTVISSSGKRLGRLKRVQRKSPTLGAKPPEGAVVIFDGSKLDQLKGGEKTESGLLKEGVQILPMFQDFNLHAEFRLPYMPLADGQQRGNSGFYLQSRYECQVLDSFGTERMFNGLGALYRQKAPDLNMALPPLVWQTYDIHFTAPRWAADGKKIRNARITSWINGVKVQDDVSVSNKTGAGKEEAPTLLPTHLQDHGDPVRYRNIWIVDRGITNTAFPVMATKAQRTAAAIHEWQQPQEEESEKLVEVAAEVDQAVKETAKPKDPIKTEETEETKGKGSAVEESVGEQPPPAKNEPKDSSTVDSGSPRPTYTSG
ncbi:MAG: DUF1080 domain-containing protein [Planctomycetota bacterium]